MDMLDEAGDDEEDVMNLNDLFKEMMPLKKLRLQ